MTVGPVDCAVPDGVPACVMTVEVALECATAGVELAPGHVVEAALEYVTAASERQAVGIALERAVVVPAAVELDVCGVLERPEDVDGGAANALDGGLAVALPVAADVEVAAAEDVAVAEAAVAEVAMELAVACVVRAGHVGAEVDGVAVTASV